MISGDPNTNPQTATSTFFGRISVGGNSSKENLAVTEGQTISVEGLIVPQHQDSADIIVVGLYVPENSKRLDGTAVTLPQTASKEYCDPELGDFYMNTAGDSSNNTNHYCNWIVDRNGGVDTSNWCNTPDDSRRAALGIDVMSFWDVWKGGNLGTLGAMYKGVSLDSKGVSKLLYKDTVNYTGQVCLYFGYRLEDNVAVDKRTLVFNGEPIIFRVTPKQP